MRILQIDSSARPGIYGRDNRGSHTRRLTSNFVRHWLEIRPQDEVVYRNLGASPPAIIDGDWIAAAFASPERREPWMAEVLAESDQLVAELKDADVLVIGAPLYNFGPPAALKAWVDMVVRVGQTFDFNRSDPNDHYVPLLRDRPRQAVVLSARGGHGFGPGGELAHMNHLEPALTTVLQFIGFPAPHCIAVEHQEDGGDLLKTSVARADEQLAELVERMTAALRDQPLAATDNTLG